MVGAFDAASGEPLSGSVLICASDGAASPSASYRGPATAISSTTASWIYSSNQRRCACRADRPAYHAGAPEPDRQRLAASAAGLVLGPGPMPLGGIDIGKRDTRPISCSRPPNRHFSSAAARQRCASTRPLPCPPGLRPVGSGTTTLSGGYGAGSRRLPRTCLEKAPTRRLSKQRPARHFGNHPTTPQRACIANTE